MHKSAVVPASLILLLTHLASAQAQTQAEAQPPPDGAATEPPVATEGQAPTPPAVDDASTSAPAPAAAANPAELRVVTAEASPSAATASTVEASAALDPALAAPAPPPEPPTSLTLSLPNGNSIKFGLLLQLQYEALGNPNNDDLSQNLFLRQVALLVGGTVLEDFEYFFDTDFGNTYKGDATTGVKNGPGMDVKDAYVTYKGIGEFLKVDGGLLMPPSAHNALQGGGTIYALDFYQNSFRHNGVFKVSGQPRARDLGVQFRGLVGDGLLEYRAGAFQGRRDPVRTDPPHASARNPFRLGARVQLNLLDPETGYFYAGTYLGKKSILSFGGAYDFQYDPDGSYRAWSADGFLDVPAGPGGVTAQVNFVARDGGDEVELPEQKAIMAEAGYRIDPIKLSPIVRYEQRWAEDETLDHASVGGGLSFWAYGHNSNLKVFYIRQLPRADGLQAYHQFNAQWQLFFF